MNEKRSYYEKACRRVRLARYGVLLFLLLFVIFSMTFFRDEITFDNFRYLMKYIEVSPPSMGGEENVLSISGGKNASALLNEKLVLADDGTIVSYDLSEVYDEKEPEVVNTVSISSSTLDAVKEGMLSVTEDGTGRAALGDYPIKVGGKTGTSQTNNGADHSVFIAFAPFENPKIAISVVLEHGNSGYSAGSVVRIILDAYFMSEDSASPDTMPFTVLN